MSNMMSWDPAVIRAPVMPWPSIHHIKQEPMEPTMGNGFLSSNSEGFHSSSPSSSSRGSPPVPHSPPFHPLTPPGFEPSPAGRPAQPQLPAAVTPPKSPSPPWANSSLPSPGESSPEGDEEPGLRVPAVNSHGKVKTFKCKQCEFVAVTKLDFWDHTKSHIKPERMLNCQKCPFVTEYKHHLEYHMRNHIGSKPFQCNKCSYSCVNKSMLNSHLKSHSNVYQYRCVDCNYATKYCHSLKLHLRKYEHQPAMVLNQDGTPNPLPIIDVYGTRRGPKQRAQLKEDTANNNIPVQHPLFQNPFAVNFSYGPLLPHAMLFPNNNSMPEPPTNVKPSETALSPPKDVNNPLKNMHNLSPHLLMQQRFFSEFSQSSPNALSLPTTLPHSSPIADDYSPRSSHSPHQSVHSSPRGELDNSDALDLTSSTTKQDAPATPAANQKNRRKGRAFKLDRSVPRVEQPDDSDHYPSSADIIAQLKNSEAETVEIQVDLQSDVYESIKNKYEADKEAKGDRITVKQAEELRNNVPKPVKEIYDCQFCDIVFKDIIMYTMHMGYHGFNDAFTCNMCGEKTSDKVAFFVHIARAQHS